jgi:hypothetical protein
MIYDLFDDTDEVSLLSILSILIYMFINLDYSIIFPLVYTI